LTQWFIAFLAVEYKNEEFFKRDLRRLSQLTASVRAG